MQTINTDKVESQIGISKIAIDMHLKSFRVVRQLDHASPQPAQKFTPEKFYPWLEKEIAKAGRVVVCYEAGCFGYGPARRMQKMGAEVLVIAPQNWDEQSKRQVNDKLDA
jgi:transposase